VGPPRKLSSSAAVTIGRVAVTPKESERLKLPPDTKRGLELDFLFILLVQLTLL